MVIRIGFTTWGPLNVPSWTWLILASESAVTTYCCASPSFKWVEAENLDLGERYFWVLLKYQTWPDHHIPWPGSKEFPPFIWEIIATDTSPYAHCNSNCLLGKSHFVSGLPNFGWNQQYAKEPCFIQLWLLLVSGLSRSSSLQLVQ